MFRKVMHFLEKNLFAGIIVILPITVTIFIIRFFVVSLNSIMLNPLAIRLKPYLLQEEQRLFLAKAVVFIAALLIIIFIGIMTRIIIVRKTFSFFEKFLYKLPMVNKIYGAIKEISKAFLGNKKSGFKKVVLVEYPRKGIYTIGFVTSESMIAFSVSEDSRDLVSIYIPTTPNPTSGLFIMVPKGEVKALDMSVEEALKVVISAGAIAPPNREISRRE